MYEYKWITGKDIARELLQEMASLYSANYGIWGAHTTRPGAHVKIPPDKLQHWLSPADSHAALAFKSGKLVGYAIVVQKNVPGCGIVSWVTQLVVEETHRQANVAKRLLFTAWEFSDHFAWGLVTANPYAVRALEKATRRRCIPGKIKLHEQMLLTLGVEVAPAYIKPLIETKTSATESRINTKFFLDHSQLPEMLLKAAGPDRVWQLGPLEEGWEWFAFTFHDQQPFSIPLEELEQMLMASDEITQQAFSRASEASVDRPQPWARHAAAEITFLIETCSIKVGDSVLDFGCDQGRHAIELAKNRISAVGVDYVRSAVEAAKKAASSVTNVEFLVGDCRSVKLSRTFDAGICLYDVIGSFPDDESNLRILHNLASHVKPNGYVVISVMNFDLANHLCKSENRVSITAEPDKLLSLKPGNIMESTGDIFQPNYYMIDKDTQVVYRKEQFVRGESLPRELLVRDKRFTKEQIEELCTRAGLDVLWSRFVRAGRWRDALPRLDSNAKEILVICRKPDLPAPTLFDLT
jgi:2-polyprenyl-3-methyl-5-hydroxy-6-metoxy-1,4-benzoquinol methylase